MPEAKALVAAEMTYHDPVFSCTVAELGRQSSIRETVESMLPSYPAKRVGAYVARNGCPGRGARKLGHRRTLIGTSGQDYGEEYRAREQHSCLQWTLTFRSSRPTSYECVFDGPASSLVGGGNLPRVTVSFAISNSGVTRNPSNLQTQCLMSLFTSSQCCWHGASASIR